MTYVDKKIRISLNHLHGKIPTYKKAIEGIEMAFCGYKTSNTPPADLKWEPYKNGGRLFKADEHAWIHFVLDLPENPEGEVTYFNMTTGREGGWDACNPQGIVYINGTSAIQALDVNHTSVILEPGHNDIYIYFYSGSNDGNMTDVWLNLNINLYRKSLAVEKLYYDMLVPFDALSVLDKNSYEYNTIIACLEKACNFLDFRWLSHEDFMNGVAKAQEYMEKEFYEKECGKDAPAELSFIGHTHIDVAWKWTLAQTEEKSQSSFATALKLMEQYPDYVFMSSQPQLYEYVKKHDPVLFERIKEKIKEGRWEAEGAMWLECDANLVSGESFIRQIVYGKRFMKDELGVENRSLWLPDVFGYSAALPQILRKCGVDTFFTTKIYWNETNQFPHDVFMWKGIDGTEIFSVFSKDYVKRLQPDVVMRDFKGHIDKKYTNTHIATFGFGDGGGGPTPHMCEMYDRLKRGLPGFPKVTQRPAMETIDIIREQFNKSVEELKFVPKWSGELYLEMHRGTYTTMAENKKANRQSEFLFQKAETASAIAKTLKGASYPKSELDEGWIIILRNQFHDIIPGSSIKEVYEDSRVEYAKVFEIGNKAFDTALDTVASDIKTEGGLLVYNPTSYTVSDIVKVDGKDTYIENIPAHGYAVVKPTELKNTVVVGDKHIENDLISVTFDENYNIVSIYDKANDREIIKSGEKANVFEIFEDYPREYDAWEITEYYKSKKWTIDNVVNVTEVKGELSGGLCIERKYGNSTFKQNVILRTGSERVDFDTEIDWHENHVLLKAAFPLDIETENVTGEIQFGHLDRPTHYNTSWDEAKFEVCCHKWAELTEEDYGVAILNDCKYGYSAEGNVLKITLLKAPKSPNPEADMGAHKFTYCIYPHAGACRCKTVKEAYILNNPLTVKEIAANANGTLSDNYSFITTNAKGAVTETAKLAEDGNGYIVRVYEAQSIKEKATLTFGFDVKEAYFCDMLENNEEKVEVNGNTIKVPLTNFEIKTIRVIPA